MEKLRAGWLARGLEPADFERMFRDAFAEVLENKRREAEGHE
jgi:hypothetical protein